MLVVRRLERLRDLSRDRQRFVDRNRPLGDAVGERRSLDELHHESRRAFTLLETVNLCDVRMVEPGEHFRLALKTRQTIGVGCKNRGKNFDGDRTLQVDVCRPIDLTHTPAADQGDDFVWS